MDVLHLAERYQKIRFILSKDCKMSPNFLKKHGFSPDVREKMTYVAPCAKYQVDDLTIETLRSTDEGVAFYVTTNGASFYHAGDLNNWCWDGAGESCQRQYGGKLQGADRSVFPERRSIWRLCRSTRGLAKTNFSASTIS